MPNKILLKAFTAVFLVVFGLCGAAWSAPVPADNPKPVEKNRKDKNPKPDGWIALDQQKAIENAHQKYPYVSEVLIEDLPIRQQRLRSLGIGFKDIKNSYILLDSPYVNTYENKYGPVRFMHAKHAASLNGDCAACHHYRPADKKAEETVACRTCHQDAFTQKDQERIGLKAAYHMQCMDCHESMKQGPVSCEGCHANSSTDHKELVILPDNPKPSEVTAECLRCHQKVGKDMLDTAHWLWRGPSPYTAEHRKSVMAGKGTTTINNF